MSLPGLKQKYPSSYIYIDIQISGLRSAIVNWREVYKCLRSSMLIALQARVY